MNYAIAALAGALFLSISDMFANYALESGLSTLNHCFWSHAVVYVVAITGAILLLSEQGQIRSNVGFPDNTKAGLSSIAAGVFAVLALFAINHAFAHSKNIGYTVTLVSTTGLITLLVSTMLLGKQLQSRGTLGCGFVLVGVWLISGSDNSR